MPTAGDEALDGGLLPDVLEELEPSADPATGEVSGNGEPALCYGNGSPVGDNPDERKAYCAHVATVKAIPASIDALREWAKALTSRA